MPGFTRQQIRRVVAAELGDFMVATATAPGTVATMIDAITFVKEFNHFRGARIYFSKGSNQGATTTAQANDPQTRTITFNPPMTIPTAIGDEAEIYNFHHQGWEMEEINRAINAAIAVAGEQHGLVPTAYQLPTPYVTNTGDLTIPLTFSEFHGVSYVDRQGNTKMLPPRYWEVNRYARTVMVKRNGVSALNGRMVTLLGMQDPLPADTDDSLIMLPLEWMRSEVKAILLEADTAQGAINQRDRLFNVERTGADGRRPLVLSNRPPNSVRLR